MTTRHRVSITAFALLLGLPGNAHAGLVFHDDFESGTSAWTLTGGWGQTSIGPHDGTKCLTDTPSTNYTANASTTATTAVAMNLSGAKAPRLKFWIRHSSEFLHDWLHVETSKNGTAWLTQNSFTGGDQVTWRHEDITLPGYEGSATFYVRFRVQTDAIVNGDGWYIDDLLVEDGNPAVVVTAPRAGTAWAGGTTQSITWTYDGSFAPLAKTINVTYAVDDLYYFNPLQEGLAIDATSYSWLVPATNEPQAQVRVELIDALGAVLTTGTSAPFVVDSAAPGAVNLLSPSIAACGSGTPTFDWSDATGAASYTLTVTPTGGPPLVKTGITASTVALSAGDALSSAGNPHGWQITALDAAGNATTSTGRSYTADTTPPAVFSLSSPPDGTVVTDGEALVFTWQGTIDVGCGGLSKYRLHIDGDVCADDIAPGGVMSIALASTTCTSLAGGPHTWTVSAVDAAGNVAWSTASPGGTGGFQFRTPAAAVEAGVPDASAGGASNVGSGGSSGSTEDAGASDGGVGADAAVDGDVSTGAGGAGAMGGAAGSGGVVGTGAGGVTGSSGSAGRSGGAGTVGTAGQATDGGAAPSAKSDDSGGCGCRTSPTNANGSLASLLVAALILVRRRRRMWRLGE